MLMVLGLSAPKVAVGRRPTRSTDASTERRDRMDLETQVTIASTFFAVERIASMRNRRLMEADKRFARPSAFATGRAPTALAAFIKRPQAVRFKSALPLKYGLSHCMSKRKIWSNAARKGNLLPRRAALGVILFRAAWCDAP